MNITRKAVPALEEKSGGNGVDKLTRKQQPVDLLALFKKSDENISRQRKEGTKATGKKPFCN